MTQCSQSRDVTVECDDYVIKTQMATWRIFAPKKAKRTTRDLQWKIGPSKRPN